MREACDVVVYNSLNAVDVHLAKARLESEGIRAVVSGETLNQVFGGVQGITQGVSLMVSEADAQSAVRLLRAEGYLALPDPSEAMDSTPLPKTAGSIRTIIVLILLVLLLLAIYTYIIG